MAKTLFFAQARQAAGCPEADWPDAQDADAEALWIWLGRQFPGLSKIRQGTRLARNGRYLEEGERFAANDEIALLPPVSGG